MTNREMPNQTYSIHAYSGESLHHKEDIDAYYALRRKVYVQRHGPEQDKYYGTYPTPHDARKDTIFIIYKAKDPETGKEIVFGGNRMTFPTEEGIGTLPFEGKHEILDHTRVRQFKKLSQRKSVDIRDVVPAVEYPPPAIKCAEFGAFAIDRALTDKIFTSKEDYEEMRGAIYRASLEAAKEAGAGVVAIDTGLHDMKHWTDWLSADGQYQFKHLGRRTVDLFSNPLPHNKTQMLLVSTDPNISLSGPGGVLRYNQEAAAKARTEGRG